MDPRLGEKLVGRLLGPLADRFRDVMPLPDYLDLLLELLYIRCCDAGRWTDLVSAAGSPADSAGLGAALQSMLDDRTSNRPGLEHRVRTDGLRSGDERNLASVIDVLNRVPPVGRRGVAPEATTVFRLLVQRFAELEGRKGGEFVTPPTVVRLMVELLKPAESEFRVYDPFCRTGEFLSAVVEMRTGDPSDQIVVGRCPNERIRRMAQMNLAMHGVEADLGPGPSVAMEEPADPSRRFDLVLTNPPFGMRSSVLESRGELRWRYGPPPENNANFGWLQHVVASLDVGGRAAVLMANNASFSANSRERAIRAAMVEDGAVECLIALPAQLFSSTAIPVTVWLLRHPTGSCDEIFFIDARESGAMASRVLRFLSGDDIEAIVDVCATWQGQRDDHRIPQPGRRLGSRAVPITEIRARDHSLNPLVYLQASAGPIDVGAEAGTLSTLAADLMRLQSCCGSADAKVDRMLREIGIWNR